MLATEHKQLSKFMKKLRKAVKEFESDMLERLTEEPEEWADLSESGLWETFAGYCGEEE